MRSRVSAWSFLTLLTVFFSLSAGAESTLDTQPADPPANLNVANRTVMVFRATLLGETPALRAQRANAVIDEALQNADSLQVSIDPIQNSYMVLMGGRRVFFVSPRDVDPVQGLSLQETAEKAAGNLRLVVAEVSEGRDLQMILRALLAAAVATLCYVVLLWVVSFIRRKLSSRLLELMRRHSRTLRVGPVPLLDTNFIYTLIRRLMWLVRWLVIGLLSYEWLGFVLSRFPYTRPWGERLNNYLFDTLRYLFEAVIGAIPGLGLALIIFFIARGASAFSRRVIKRMASPGTLSWLNEETLQPTTRLTSLAIWLFALAMAYPYLPGAGTEAFKGLSVLVGLMISLGASSVVGQAAAGLILTYTRTLRPGEFVKIGEHEGTVTELGMFTTRIRTGLGEVLTIPNSMITGTVTKNYSRTVQGEGYVVDTTVTIGYDTPWRQVEAMLLEAAKRTNGVLMDPAPRVFQTALSDFYPEYRLVAQAIPAEPRPRAVLLSMLHANIQDVFNEYGVQIMSPHYLGDPNDEKWVPRDKWFQAPAQEPKDS